ncbi:MAG: CDP-glucose 4,6-dehydratase [Campylobacteraceae bacterium]|nr:CDP-glucose 4,6-dehydratase [Campylobacteraceae bacterium]
MQSLFGGIYNGKTVLLSGHTGFKGSWLAFWLSKMGAKVVGYALEAPTTPNHFELLGLDIVSLKGDIRDEEHLAQTFATYKPDIVFHLAAQALVRASYEEPVLTYETNVMGTLKVFEACRKHKTQAIVNITSDKAYENKEWIWGYRESDPLGGYDPYSSSKGCAEVLSNSYRNSYFNVNNYKKTHETLLASCRAGNVIGGGDWAQDRLMSDIMISTAKNERVYIRNPNATRPWQHVLEPLSGYLTLGQKLLEGRVEFSEAWNFGPSDEGSLCVEDVVKSVKKHWDRVDYEVKQDKDEPHEANFLKLDCSKAHIKLNWKSVWSNEKAFEKTVKWYKNFYENGEINTESDLREYISDAKVQNAEWAK